ncbi:MAG TPA: hypothetical protein VIT67_00730 [Povalibacter sp.]
MQKLLLSTALCLAGCAHSQPPADSPAVIVNPSIESRAELRAVVATALDAADVTIADDALTQSATLFIERGQKRDARGQPLSGRELGRPERFDLIISAGKCVLVRASDSKRFPLPHTSCNAI